MLSNNVVNLNSGGGISPLVSVIVNCYNGSRYLRDALNSVMEQSYHNWEVVFWDNQSTDDSALIFKEFNDNRMRYFMSSEFTNLGEARNLAVNCARGDWIAFLDCDDVWVPNKLSSQLDIIRTEDSSLGFVYGKALILMEANDLLSIWGKKQSKYSKKSTLSYLYEGDIFAELVKINFVPLLTAIVRKDSYLEVGGVSPDFVQAEDYDLFVRIAAYKRVRAVDDVVAYYRIHADNASHRNLEVGYIECRSVVSKFLPDPRAQLGLIFHHTYYAIHLITSGRIVFGGRYLIKNGSLLVLVSLIAKRVLFRLLRMFTFQK